MAQSVVGKNGKKRPNPPPPEELSIDRKRVIADKIEAIVAEATKPVDQSPKLSKATAQEMEHCRNIVSNGPFRTRAN